MLKTLRRFTDARSVEGKIVAVILVIALALMAWDVNALRSAFADDSAPVAAQSESDDNAEKERAAKEKAEKEAAEKAAAEKVEREAAEKAAREKAEREAAEKAEREAAQKAEREAAEQAQREAAEQAQRDAEPEPAAPAAEPEPAAAEPDVTEPDTPDATEPDATEPDSPDATEPDDGTDQAGTDDGKEDGKDADKKAEEKFPAVVLYGKAGGVTVKLTAPEGALPEGVQLRVKDVTSDSLASQVEQATDQQLSDYQAIDITIVDKNSHEVQPKKAVNVTFVGAGLEGDDVSVYHVDGGAVDQVRTLQADSNTQSFDARSFSVYFIAAAPKAADDTPHYTVTFISVDDDGVETVISHFASIAEGETVGTLPEAPFQANRHFTGWVNRDTGEAVTADTVVTSDITAVAQFSDVRVYQVTVNHWYHNPVSGDNTTFNTTIVELEPADLPYNIDSPVSTEVGTDVDSAHPTYIPTEPYVTITADDLADAKIVDGKGYLTRDVEFVPYNTTYYFVYMLANLNGNGYSEVARDEVQGVLGSTVTPTKKNITGGVFDHADTTTVNEEGQEIFAYYNRAQYRVTFDVNGGNYIDAQMVPYGSSVQLPTPERTGYQFQGWYTDQDLTNRVTGSVTVQGPTTLYAKWSAQQVNYTLLYTIENADDDGYSYLGSVTQRAEVGTEITATKNSAKPNNLDTTNFTFKDSTTAKVKADGSTVITVRYSRNVYTIKWTGDVYNTSGKRRAQNQGTGSITAKYGAPITQAWVQAFNTPYPQYAWSFTTKNNDKIISIDTMPGKAGMTLNNDGSIRLNAFDFSTTKVQILSYWLENYDEGTETTTRNGKTYGLLKSITAKFNYLYDDSDFYPIVGYAKDGYTATYTSGGRTYSYTMGNSTPNAQLDVDFYYSANTYNLAFYDYDGSLISTHQVKLGEDISSYMDAAKPEAPVEGAEWLGWFTDAERTAAYAGNSKMPTGLALYAAWKMPERTITFMDVPADGSAPVELAKDTVDYGTPAESITPDAREGYTFQGWYTDANYRTLYDFGRPLTSDVTVYAKWAQTELSYTVKYVDANDPDREVLPSKTVQSPALALGQTVEEKAATVAGMLPDASTKSVTLALQGNEIVFTYTAKQNVITYDVKYVLEGNEDIQVAPARTGVQVSGDIVSVKESAAAVDYALLEQQGITGVVLHPVSEVIDYTFSTGENVIVFRYSEYKNTKFIVNYKDMDGNPIPGVPQMQQSVRVGGGFQVPAALNGYTLDHVEKNGADQGKRTYYVAQAGEVDTIDLYYQTNLVVTAKGKTKEFDGQPLVSQGTGDCTVYGLRAGHELTGIEYTGSQTQVGSTATTPKNARITGPANANYYAIDYVSGTLTVTKPQVVVEIVGDQVEAVYDGQPHEAGYKVESISNPKYLAEYIQFNGTASTVSRTHVGSSELKLAGMFSTVASQTNNFDVIFHVRDGGVNITQATLTVHTDSAEKVYDGTPLTATGCSLEGLVEGETLPIVAIGSITDAGSVSNDVDFDWNSATAQQSDYRFVWKNGRLTVKPAPLTITALAQDYLYNGQPQGEDAATYTDTTQISGKVQASGLAAGDALSSITLDGTQTKVGVYEGEIVPSAAQVTLGHTPDEGSAAASDALANYEVSYASGTLTIRENAEDLRLTAESGGGVYNGTAYGLGLVRATIANATIEYKVGDGEWTTEAPTATNVADSKQGISVRAVLEGYTTAQVDNLNITVTPRPVTVTAQDNGKTYGTEDPALEAEPAGLLGEDTVEFTVARAEGEDVGTYAITPSGEAVQGNYEVTYVPGTFSISPREVTVTANDATKVYGEEDPAFDATVEGLVEGDSADAISYTLTRAPGENVGGYAITASGEATQGNYRVVFAPGSLTITPAAVTVTADAATKVYGDADPAFTAQVEGLVNGDDASVLTYSLSRAEGEDVGEYAITPAGQATQGNYTVTYAPAALSITPAALTVTALDAGKVYGEADPEAFEARIDGLKFNDAYESIVFTTSRAEGENVGEYAITPAGEATQGNYTVTYAPGTFTITKAKAVVTAQDASKEYGNPDPQLTATVSGLVEGDSLAYEVTRAEGEHVGTYEISVTGDAEQGNYDVVFVPATFTIEKAAVTVTVADATKVYGDADPDYTVTMTGLKGDDTESLISYTLSREPGEDVGEYALTLSGADVQGDYTVSFVPAKLTITPAAVVVRVDAATKTYGDADPAFTAQVEGLKRGDSADLVAYTLSRAPGESVGDYAITATGGATQGNYTVTYEAGTLSIGQAPVEVVAIDASKEYGTDDPAFAATVKGLRNGDTADVVTYELSRAAGEDVGEYALTPAGEASQGNYQVTYTPGTFSIVASGTLAVTGTSLEAEYSGALIGVAAVPSVTTGTTVEYRVGDGDWSQDVPTLVNVGTVTVQVRATNSNYQTATAEYTLTVTPKPVTVTAANASKVYGTDDPEAFAYTVSGLVEGEDEGLIKVDSTTRAEGENVGEYAITPAGKAEQGNYSITYVEGTFAITPKGVTVTGNDASKVYGTDDPDLTATVEGLVGDDTITYTVSRSEGEDVGIYAVMPMGEATQGNYTVTYVAGHFNITKAQATVAAQAAAKTYGDADPAFTAVVTGLVGGDSLVYSLSRTEGEDVGAYEIMPTGDVTQGNYEVTFLPAAFTVKPARVTVTADDKSQVYGANPQTLTASVTGLKNGDDPSVISYELARATGNNVGTYDITPTGKAEQGNYLVSYELGTYTILPAMVTVAARDAGKVYGQDDPELSAAVTGLLFNDTIDYTLARAAGEDVGSYAITPSGDVRQGNYQVLYVPGTFTISKATLTVTADDKTQVYGDAAKTLTATVTGLVNGDAAGVVSYELARAAGDAVGSYAITPTLAAEPANYTVQLVPGTYRITPAPVVVAPVATGKTYGQADPELTATVRGLKNGESEDLINYSLARTPGENAGVYSISASGATEQGNYLVSYQTADFTIARALATVAANAQAKVYGDPDPTLTATVTGLVAGDTPAVLSYTLSREAGEDVGEYPITAVGADIQGNYDVVYADSTLTIARSGELAVVGTNVEVTFDGTAHGSAAVPSVVTNTTVEYSTDGGATWQAEVPTRTDVGTTEVQVRATNSNYETATATYTIRVNPKPVTVTANDAGKTYGEDDPELTATVTGLVGSDAVAYTVERVAGENVGTYAITASGEAEQGNYLVSYAGATFTIERSGALAVFAVDAQATYDGQRHEIGAAIPTVAEGTQVLYRLDGTSAWSEELPGAVDAGTYTVHVRAINPNYLEAAATCTLTIDRAAATVTAVDASKTYGDADPALSAAVTGLVPGDAPSAIAYSVSRASGEDAGAYAITPTGEAVQGNYNVSYVPATFTINRAPVAVVVADAGKIYGDADPAFTATVSGLKSGDTESVIHYSISREAGENVGTYALSAVGAVEQGNYTVTYVPATFTIGRAQATVTAVSASKTYGDDDPVFTATVSGLKGGDTADVLDYAVTRDAGEDVGEYKMTASGDAIQGNYDVSYEPGTFIIGRAGTLVVSGTSLEGTYTGSPYGVPAVASVVAGTTIEYRVNGGAWTAIAPTRTDVGESSIEVRATNPNYETATASYTLRVNPAEVVVTADDASKVYGEPDPSPLRYTVTGLVADEPHPGR